MSNSDLDVCIFMLTLALIAISVSLGEIGLLKSKNRDIMKLKRAVFWCCFAVSCSAFGTVHMIPALFGLAALGRNDLLRWPRRKNLATELAGAVHEQGEAQDNADLCAAQSKATDALAYARELVQTAIDNKEVTRDKSKKLVVASGIKFHRQSYTEHSRPVATGKPILPEWALLVYHSLRRNGLNPYLVRTDNGEQKFQLEKHFLVCDGLVEIAFNV